MSGNHHEMTEDELWAELADLEGRERAHALTLLADFRYGANDFPAGLTLAEESAAAYEAAGDLRGHALALEGVARGQHGTCEHGAAVTTLLQAAELLDQHGEPRDLLDIYEGLGHVYRSMRSYHKALEAFEATYRITRDLGAPSRHELSSSAATVAGSLDAIGGRDPEVISYLTEALETSRGDASAHWQNHQTSVLVRAHIRQGDLDEARALVTTCLTVARHCECNGCITDILMDLASLEQAAGDIDAAHAAYTEAVTVAKTGSGGKPTIYDGHLQLFLSTLEADSADAFDHIEQAEALYTMAGFDWGLANCHDFRAMAAERFEDLDAALAHYTDLERTITEVAGPRELAELLYNMARIHLARGDANAAMTVLQGAGYMEDRPDHLDCRERARHFALYATALGECGRTADALRLAEWVLTATSGNDWYEVAAMVHEARARILLHSDPAGSERAAQRAQACYNAAGEHEDATRIGFEFFIEPYETLARIDVDNQARAAAEEAERRVRTEDAARWEQSIVAKSVLPDPIDDQVNRPDSGDGQASTATA